MNFETRMANIKAKVEAVKQLATRLYGVDLSRLRVRYDLHGAAGGWAIGNDLIRLNVDFIADHRYDAMLNNTVAHEIAHIVCHIRPMLGRKHNPGWKRVCLALGGNGKRCHSEDVVYANGETYEYTTDKGFKVRVSRTVHKRLQNGTNPWYRWRRKGTITKNSPFVMIGAGGQLFATPKVPAPAPHVVTHAFVYNPPAQKQGGQTNASKVREWIRLAKSLNRDQNSVIATAMTNLGMPKSQASRYVTENWNRV